MASKKKEPEQPEDDYTFPNQITFDDLLTDPEEFAKENKDDIIEEEEPPCQKRQPRKASPS